MSDLVRFDRPPETPADDQPDWTEKLRRSDRSERLVKAIIGAVTMLQTRASTLESAVAVPADGPSSVVAEHVLHETRVALTRFEGDAAALAEKRLPGVVDLYGDYVIEKTGVSAVDTEAATQQLIATVKDALGDTVAEVRKAVEDAVAGWFHNDGSIEDLRRIVREQLADAEWQAARVMRTEIQEAYKDLTRRALREGPATRVYRQAQAAACEFCVAKEGEYDIDDPDAYDSHPNCCCVWYALDADGREVGDAGVAEMSKLSKAEREKLPLSDFGDPDNRLFPIVDQSDVEGAAHLIGKAKNPDAVKRRIVAIAKRKGFSIPDAWKTADNSAGFSLGAGAAFSGDLVRRKGKVWEAGDYPDKNFGMTPEEMLAAVAEFTPQPGDLEHTETVLSGKLGRLVEVEIGENPYDLIGTVEMPKWLSDELPDELPVSVSWNRQTKRIEGIAYVVDPRVADAAVAAFAKRHDTPHGQYAMQEMHDVAARHGAVCKAPTADMASRHEATAIQSMHDTAVQHGAKCAAVGAKGGGMPWFSKHGGFAMPKMSSLFKFWEQKGRPDEIDLQELATFSEGEGTQGQHAPAAAQAQPDPEVATLKDEIAKLKAAGIVSEAAAFAAGEIAAKRSMPWEQEQLTEEYTLAATDDATHGAVTFSGTTTSRVEALKARHAKRPAHALTEELLSDPEQVAQFATLVNEQKTRLAGEAKPMSAERKQAMLGATATGRQVLESRN